MWHYIEFSADGSRILQEREWTEARAAEDLRLFQKDNEEGENIDLIMGSIEDGWFFVFNVDGTDDAICIYKKEVNP